MYRIDVKTFRERLKEPSTEAKSLFIDNAKHLKVYKKLQKTDYSDFIKLIKRCKSCTVRDEHGYPPTPPKGSIDSFVVFQGRNPGRQEAENQEPFYHKAPGGNCFNKYLELFQLSRQDCYITNSLFCYTLDDRPPKYLETMKCSYWKNREYSYLIKSKFIFLLGNDAVKFYLNPDYYSILNILGRVFWVNRESPKYIIPILHPGYILRNRPEEPLLWEHLNSINDRYIKPFKEFLNTTPSELDIAKWKVK